MTVRPAAIRALKRSRGDLDNRAGNYPRGTVFYPSSRAITTGSVE
jgi:hypothetical protein